MIIRNASSFNRYLNALSSITQCHSICYAKCCYNFNICFCKLIKPPSRNPGKHDRLMINKRAIHLL